MAASQASLRRTIALIGATVVASPAERAAAQRSTLSQPQQSVFAAFPQADGYQVIVREVDDNARRAIEQRLPFRVHYSELGAHAMYVAVRGRLPLGLLYARDEESPYGLTAVEWALTLDGRLAGLKLRRTRSNHWYALERSGFTRLLVGMSRPQLEPLLTPAGGLADGAFAVPAGTEALAAALVRSALKTMAVLDVVWAGETAKLHDLAVGRQQFPNARRIQRIWPRPAGRPGPPLPAADGPVVEVALALRVLGAESRTLGWVIDVRTPHEPQPLRWTLDAEAVVTAAETSPSAAAPLRAQWQSTRDLGLAELCAADGVSGAAARRVRHVLGTLRPEAR